MPVPCLVDAGAGSAISVPASTNAFLFAQGTNSSGKPTRLKRFTLTSNNTGASQQTIELQLGTYATGSSTGGSSRTAVPVDHGLQGVYSPSTAFYCGTATMGTTFTNIWSGYWNTANPFDWQEGMLEIQDEFPVSKVWAIITPAGPANGCSAALIVWFEEFG